MEATRRSLEAQPKIQKILSEHQIYQSGRKFSLKNYVSYLKSVKEPEIRTRRNLQAQPKIQKILSEHQIYQSGRKFPKKNYVSYLKSV
jgi:hypothetical protein